MQGEYLEMSETGLSKESPDLPPNVWEENDRDNPYNWPKGRKWLITAYICFLCLAATMGSSIYTPGILVLAGDFHIGPVAATLPLSIYVLGWALGPLVFAPLSEVYGRNFVYRSTWAVFFVIQIGCALSKNLGALLPCRFIAGLASGATITIVVGSFTDIWIKEEVGPPLALCASSAYLGPVFGPVIGGFLVQYVSWQWTFWFTLIWTGALGLGLILLPETYHPVLLERKAHRKGKGFVSTNNRAEKLALFRGSLTRPLVLLVKEPVVFFMSIYLSFVIALLNLYFCSYPIIYHLNYKLGSGISGLAFLGIGVGVLFATATAKQQNNLFLKLLAKHGPVYPEARLPFSLVAAVLLPASIFWFAWTGVPGTHPMVSIASGVPFGWSMLMIVLSIMSYLSDAYREYSASVTASLTLCRSLMAMGFPLFAPSLYTNVKTQWAGSILGFVALGLAPIPFIFYKFGPYLRSKSSYTFKMPS